MMFFLIFSLAAVEAARLRTALPEYNDPCPFGYGTNCQNDSLDPKTKAEVGAILEGILKNLQGKKGLVQMKQKVNGAPAAWSTPVNKALLQAMTKLQKSDDFASSGRTLSKLIAAEPPSAGCKYFGVCSPGENPPMDPATKAQVTSILEGMLKNLQSQR
eukprot:gnl/MRDRNA2_/MRDRNA2_59638_c0_seq1.p1 gnl/MRDRNA2_/MRDRNA2_59638_c0~~gnl/MRDRNA2_/MRDRNA2_59638_c0_seq1.p1  ORF type:complete len:159 (-),score=42.59 gnl/MRDRNA2_/MRDRNA2_59638_c0_seq1:7-483(-)